MKIINYSDLCASKMDEEAERKEIQGEKNF